MADIELTDEQAMLLDTAADFCRNHSPMDRVRARIEQEHSVEPHVWQQMVELGWLGINVPAEHGGLGLGMASLVPIAEAMGRYLMASPLDGSVLASEAMVANGSADQQSRWLPQIVAGSVATVALTEPDGSWQLGEMSAVGTQQGDAVTLAGEKCFVLDLPLAEVIVVSIRLDGEPRLALIEKGQLPAAAWQRETVIDETRRSYRLRLDDITIPAAQVMPGADFRVIERAGLMLLSAQIAGGLVGVLHVIVDYLTTRKQFDKLIGSYQALKHPTVDILLSAEASRSHAYHVATLLDRHEDEAAIDTALHMAKAQGSEAFAWAGDRAIQFHGALGFTWECDAQLYLRRALWCQYQFGDERYHRQRLGPLLLGEAALGSRN